MRYEYECSAREDSALAETMQITSECCAKQLTQGPHRYGLQQLYSNRVTVILFYRHCDLSEATENHLGDKFDLEHLSGNNTSACEVRFYCPSGQMSCQTKNYGRNMNSRCMKEKNIDEISSVFHQLGHEKYSTQLEPSIHIVNGCIFRSLMDRPIRVVLIKHIFMQIYSDILEHPYYWTTF
ncbi:hypothetical protein AVEN_185005-1 [Araneus ventricosus]|uniref:Uncharacterized protein n=1 Tax=Araneus ventricosus TaxID=182803 RepID=A0A4Y2BQQ2_ARAVE|nr:hypothetical protein AVEN_185005-1 [Araneus ventricosus]